MYNRSEPNPSSVSLPRDHLAPRAAQQRWHHDGGRRRCVTPPGGKTPNRFRRASRCGIQPGTTEAIREPEPHRRERPMWGRQRGKAANVKGRTEHARRFMCTYVPVPPVPAECLATRPCSHGLTKFFGQWRGLGRWHSALSGVGFAGGRERREERSGRTGAVLLEARVVVSATHFMSGISCATVRVNNREFKFSRRCQFQVLGFTSPSWRDSSFDRQDRYLKSTAEPGSQFALLLHHPTEAPPSLACEPNVPDLEPVSC